MGWYEIEENYISQCGKKYKRTRINIKTSEVISLEELTILEVYRLTRTIFYLVTPMNSVLKKV